MRGIDKAAWGWALYDWGNSAFATTVMAGLFPIFFKQYWSSGADINVSTAQLGLGNSIASLCVALIAPFLGAIADKTAARKRLLVTFAYLGVAMTAALFWLPKGQWALAILIYSLGIIGFSGSIVFYDSLLPMVAAPGRIDFVSSLGYALGYLGGGLLLLLNVLMINHPQRFGLTDGVSAVRWSFLTVAVWWGVFTVGTLLWVPEKKEAPSTLRWWEAARFGAGRLIQTFKEVRRYRTVFIFLLAYWFYIDGVDTIVRMAVDYGLSLGFDANDLIIALLLVQFIGFPAALGFGQLGRIWGVRKSIFLAIAIYIVITLWGTMMSTQREFFILAGAIGLVQGGIQALSRSYYARLIPPGRSAEFFGFYNMLGKFAAILGPVLMGGVGLLVKRMLVDDHTDSVQLMHYSQLAARWSIGSIVILFVIGATLLFWANPQRHRTD